MGRPFARKGYDLPIPLTSSARSFSASIRAAIASSSPRESATTSPTSAWAIPSPSRLLFAGERYNIDRFAPRIEVPCTHQNGVPFSLAPRKRPLTSRVNRWSGAFPAHPSGLEPDTYRLFRMYTGVCDCSLITPSRRVSQTNWTPTVRGRSVRSAGVCSRKIVEGRPTTSTLPGVRESQRQSVCMAPMSVERVHGRFHCRHRCRQHRRQPDSPRPPWPRGRALRVLFQLNSYFWNANKVPLPRLRLLAHASCDLVSDPVVGVSK